MRSRSQSKPSFERQARDTARDERALQRRIDRIDAKYDKGVLTITCPKKEPVKPKAIEIKTT